MWKCFQLFLVIKSILAVKMLLLVWLASKYSFGVLFSHCYCVLLVWRPSMAAIANPWTIETATAGAFGTFVGTGTTVMLDVLVLTSTAKNPSSFRNQIEKVLAAASTRCTWECSFLFPCCFVFLQPVTAQTSAFPHNGNTFIWTLLTAPLDNRPWNRIWWSYVGYTKFPKLGGYCRYVAIREVLRFSWDFLFKKFFFHRFICTFFHSINSHQNFFLGFDPLFESR